MHFGLLSTKLPKTHRLPRTKESLQCHNHRCAANSKADACRNRGAAEVLNILVRNEAFCRYLALAILMSLLVVAAAQETGLGTNAPSNLVISTESYSPMFFNPVFLKVYADGTVVSGTNSYTVSTQVLHSVCGELRKLGFFQS